MNKMQRISIAFIDVNWIEERIYIHFAKTHLCVQV